MNKRSPDDSKAIFSSRGFGYIDINGLCWYLYKDDTNILPSGRFITSVHGDKLLTYLHKNGTLLADGKSIDVEKTNPSSMANRSWRDFMSEDEARATYIFKVDSDSEELGIKNPVLIKVSIDESDSVALSSFSSVDVDKTCEFFFNKFSKPVDFTSNTMFGVLMSGPESTEIKQLPIDDKFSKELDLELNYGKTFLSHHKNIIEKMETNNSGLFLFHGSPGTGKTTYIKYLAKKFGGKKMFIFIPTTFIDSLTNPNIIPVLLDHPNSVLVLEDAEKAVVSRDNNHGNESLVSSLLNIGDGILGSMLNLTIILTFNTDRENVDKALLRKGRLHYEHAFDKLPIEDAETLIKKMNKTYEVTEPMSLAEIYNIDSDNNHKEKQYGKLGFGK